MNQETATLCAEEFFLRTQYVHAVLPAFQPGENVVEGGIDSQHDTCEQSSWVLISQLNLHEVKKGSTKHTKNMYNYFGTIEDELSQIFFSGVIWSLRRSSSWS
jgi:hypothetical protein